VGVDEAVGAQVQRRSETVLLAVVERDEAEFDRTVYAERGQGASELLGSHRHPEHEDPGEHSCLRRTSGSGERSGRWHALATVKGRIRPVSPQPSEGVDAEASAEEVGAKPVDRFEMHPVSQVHIG
jgi:hypothetical protein